jgi:hypothetical protein
MIVEPALSPSTSPVVEPTVATVVLLLIQLPPLVPSVIRMLSPVHTEPGPLMADGAELTVTVAVDIQPVDNL